MSDAPDLANLARAWLERNTVRNALFRNRTERGVSPEKPDGTPETQGAHEEAPSVPLFHSLGVEQWNTEPGTQEFAERHAEHLAERAAIAEHVGGLPRGWAEALARVELWEKPQGKSGEEWADMVRKAWAFADRHGAMLEARGWTFAEIFGEPRAWFDQRGAAWLEQGLLEAVALEISADAIRWRAPSGHVLTKWKAGRAPGVTTGGAS